MNIEEMQQQLVNHMMQTKDRDVAVLGNCLRYNEEVKEKAACAHKLGQIYFLTEDKSESGFKYIRMAYEFQPSNATYIESVCARSSLEISKHMFDGAFSEAEAEETLYSLSIIDKCSSHNFFTPLLIARTAYNLGFFYYKL